MSHSDLLSNLIPGVSELPDKLIPLREQILANLVMLGQIPAPTGSEGERVRYVLDRFVESGLPEAGPDEIGNAVGLLNGEVGERTICVVAHLDTMVPTTVDHNVTVKSDRVEGPSVSDNALGAAMIATLPRVLEHLGIKFDSNLLLVGSVKSLERGNHEGIRFLLDHCVHPLYAGVVVEGVELGRLNFFSIGTLRGDITCRVRPEISRSYGTESALVVMNHIINRMLKIMVPTRPYTTIKIGKFHSGITYDVEPDFASLGFEVVSHSDENITRIRSEIEDIVNEMSARHAVDANLDCFFQRMAGGIPFSHPLVKATVEIMRALDIDPDQGHSPSELSEFISRDIPAVTLGLTRGMRRKQQPDDLMFIEPILKGVAQLVATLQAIDKGVIDES